MNLSIRNLFWRPVPSFGLIAGNARVEEVPVRDVPDKKLESSRFACTFVVILALCAATGSAQIVSPSDTIASPIPGVGHDYIKMLNETVNPENGGVSLSIAIPTPPGRQLSFPFSIQYNSNQTLFEAVAYPSAIGLGWFSGLAQFDSGAWSYSVPSLSRRPNVLSVYWAGQLPGGQTPDYSMKCGVMDGYTFTAPDGSQYPLPLAHIYDNVDTYYAQTQGQGLDYACANAGSIVPGGLSERDTTPLGGIYQAALTGLDPVPECCASNPPTPNDGTPIVSGPDGTVYTFSGLDPTCSESSEYCFGTVPESIEDRNGNIVNLQVVPTPVYVNGAYTDTDMYALNVTDTLGRSLISASNFGQNGSTISVSGDPAPYTINWENFTYSGYTLTAQNESLMSQCGALSSSSTGSQTENVISSIVLPNGRSYSFTYDSKYGLISKITYPSGGSVSYTYGVDPLSSLVSTNADTGGDTGVVITPGVCFYRMDAVAVATRTVSFDGSTPAQQQTFAYAPTTWGSGGNAESWTGKTTTVTTTDQVTNTSYATTYQYVGQTFTSGVNFPNAYTVAVEGSVSTAQNSAMLKTVTQGWQGSSVLACEVDTLGSSTAAKYYSRGAGNQITDIKEFDYGQNSSYSCQSTVNQNNSYLTAPSNPRRETAVTYQQFGITTFPAGPSIFDRPCRIQQKSGSTVSSETDYLYDGETTACATASTQTVAAATVPPGTHDETSYPPSSPKSRGNATSVIKCLQGQTCPSSSPKVVLAYDETGQITSIADPCGNGSCTDISGSGHTTTYQYGDSPSGGNSPYGNSNAYLTQINYPTSPGGTSLQKKFTYNYPSGELASSTDENSETTSYTYSDPLLRLTKVANPDSGGTSYFYSDSGPNPTVTSTIAINSGTSKTSVAVMDGLGHTIQTQRTDPNGKDYVNTIFNGNGQVYRQSNPTRCSSLPGLMPSSCAESTWGVTASYYDALGRSVAQVHPDGSASTSCYNDSASTMPAGVTEFCNPPQGTAIPGTWVDSKDERGNDWQRTSDSFGNLTKVMEPIGSTQNPPSMETDYLYDSLNNLLSVTQNGVSGDTVRSRNFAYDSLSRLTNACNPESIATGSTCGPSGPWSNTYIYDNNGNVQSKSDARSIVVNYGYDNLNRLISKQYSGNAPAGSLSSCYVFDTSGNGRGLPAFEWTQTGSCPSTPPGSSPSSGYQSKRVIGSYDAMARVLTEQQCVLGYCTSTSMPATPAANCTSLSVADGLSYCYDLAGDMTAYGSGLNSTALAQQNVMFSQVFDPVARLSSLSSSWNPSQFPSNLFTLNSTSGYTPFGAAQNWALGNHLNVSKTYDTKLRVTSENATKQ
jgi:YD repeat-containing protein